MSDDLISRSALKKVIEDSVSQYGGQYSADMLNMWALFSHIIDNAPTVELTSDIRWTDKVSVIDNGDIIDFYGRVLGHINLNSVKSGADMRKGEEND